MIIICYSDIDVVYSMCVFMSKRQYTYMIIYKPGIFPVMAAKAMRIRSNGASGSLGKERIAVISLATNDYYV